MIRVSKIFCFFVFFVMLCACSPKAVVNFLLPAPPVYPDFQSKEAVVAEAQKISDDLENYIQLWLEGKANAEIPKELLPKGMDLFAAPFVLINAEDVKPIDQWIVRPSTYNLDLNALHAYFPDPHCTYIIPASVFVPFGHKVIIEGEFPYSRFFDIQMSPPFNPESYYYAKQFGAPEVPIVDVDIDPLPGHSNPFKPNADRKSVKRSYKVTFEMKIGNGYDIESGYREPLYRKAGNTRYASAIQYQGPLGYKNITGGHKRGKWDDSTIWIRYYAPDKDKNALGGVGLPKMHYETKEGKSYYIVSKNKLNLEAKLNKTFPVRKNGPKAPLNPFEQKDFGWLRDLDIFHGGIAVIYANVGKNSPAEKAEGRALVKGIAAKGGDLPQPNNSLSSNSRVPYISYLGRGLALEDNYVAVITGKLPTYPKTISGNKKMDVGQVRYFSLTYYPEPDFLKVDDIGTPYSSIMDEEMNLNENGMYTIVYSKPNQKPSNWDNATINWQNFGSVGRGGITIRWLSIGPEWRDSSIVPDSQNISYDEASWLSDQWNPNIVSRNNRSGLLGKYQPLVHYMKKETFEKIGLSLANRDTPYWEK